MLIYGVKRLGLALIICIIAMAMLFVAIRAIPGDPASIMLGSRATPEMAERLRAEMRLDSPLPIQIASFFWRLLQGDFGTDLWSKRPVANIVFESLPATLALTFAGIGWAALIGIPLGCYSAIRRGSLIDKLTSIVSVGTISIPPFVLAIYLLLLFAIKLDWFPVVGAGETGRIGDQLWHLVLPAFAVGLGWVGYLSRLVRASMIEVMGENHVRTARAFGLPPTKIVLHYALRLAIIPTVTMLAISIGSLLSTAVLVENIFSRPGLGKLIVDAASVRNYPVVQGGVFASVLLFALAMPIADLINAWLDPRVRTTL
ncbi:MAG: ABC transporter permease [Dongiaceae bacterium]